MKSRVDNCNKKRFQVWGRFTKSSVSSNTVAHPREQTLSGLVLNLHTVWNEHIRGHKWKLRQLRGTQRKQPHQKGVERQTSRSGLKISPSKGFFLELLHYFPSAQPVKVVGFCHGGHFSFFCFFFPYRSERRRLWQRVCLSRTHLYTSCLCAIHELFAQPNPRRQKKKLSHR